MSLIESMPPVHDAPTAEAFVAWAVRNIGLGFHPDTRGAEYQDKDGSSSFTLEDAALLDRRVAATFNYIDPYAVALREMENAESQATGLLGRIRRMSREKLEALAMAVVDALYLDQYDNRHDPDLVWDGSNIERVSEAVRQAGLVPDSPAVRS